jgi:hypothetical protein
MTSRGLSRRRMWDLLISCMYMSGGVKKKHFLSFTLYRVLGECSEDEDNSHFSQTQNLRFKELNSAYNICYIINTRRTNNFNNSL